MDTENLPEGDIYTIGNKKFIVSYFRDSKNNIVKSTKEYDLLKTKTTLPKSIVERRTWTKFGVSKGLSEGPDKSSTNRVYDEVFFEFTKKIKDDSVERETLITKQLKCRHCGGTHWSMKCTNKDMIDSLNKDSIEEKKNTGKYIPKFKRDGLDRDPSKKRSRENTIKISNISQNSTNEDIRELFKGFGRIQNLYYNNQKGFAYLTFNTMTGCEDAVKIVDKHPYDYLILSVEIAK